MSEREIETEVLQGAGTVCIERDTRTAKDEV